MNNLGIKNLALLRELLAENGGKCNAAGRKFIAERMPAKFERKLDPTFWQPILEYAEEVGGEKPGSLYSYTNADGKVAEVRGCDLYDLPQDMVNPYLVCFSGMMTAPLYCMEALRFYAKKSWETLPLLAIGKEGNKGLFSEEFDRTEGVMIKAEYAAYLNIFDLMAPKEYARANEKVFNDIDTAGNFHELHRFAIDKGLSEVTYVLCSGNATYDKRVIAEGILALAEPRHAGVKINLVIAHCPMTTKLATPEGHLSELMLGYYAASLGPLLKDTATFDESLEYDGSCWRNAQGDKVERYLMSGVKSADWTKFELLIKYFSNMGWPDYQKLLYGVKHDEAVENIIISDLYARGSFDAEMYDQAILQDVALYQEFIGKYAEGDFTQYLIQTTDERFF